MTSDPSTWWTSGELATIGDTGEIDLATRRRDGTLRRARIVWVVRLGDGIYVRSVNGAEAAWYRGVQTRHQGHLTAGPVDRDITFVEAGVHAHGAATQDSGLDDALDAEYQAKYGRSPSAVARITSATARATTLRLDPAGAAPNAAEIT